MDPRQLLKTLEGAVFEMALWVLLLPKTLVQVLRRPIWVLDYTTAEMAKPESERFDDYLSPVSFWLLVAVGPYLWATSTVRLHYSLPADTAGDAMSHLPILNRYMICALLLIPLVLLLHRVIASHASVPWLGLATGIGVLAGLVQGMGLARWVFLTPYLARTYQDPASPGNVKQAVAIVFQSFNQYAGAGLGEHLGYLFPACWTILISLALIQACIAPRWLGLAGVVIAVGILAGDLKVVGLDAAAQINSIAYIAWALWLIVLGVLLWIRPPEAATASSAVSVA